MSSSDYLVLTPEQERKSKEAQVKRQIHSFMVHASKFVVDQRYTPLKQLGRGAYGVVCSAKDVENKRKVAIKKIPKAFDDIVDAKRILREVKLLHFFDHDNIVALRDLIPPPTDTPFDDVYIVLDFMETDLHKIIYSKNHLSHEHMQYFIYQLLRGLKYIHSAQVIHRDLKPSNLLLNGDCDLKICDFGLARGVKEEVDYELTEYVVTRWYRAPEVMCSCQDYGHKIDVWSAGCILAELYGRTPLFPGDDYIKQMNLIFNVLGTPSDSEMGFISNAKALEYIKSLTPIKKKPFSELFPGRAASGSGIELVAADKDVCDLLDNMLRFNPEERFSVEQCLEHPYFANCRQEDEDANGQPTGTFNEPSCRVPFDFEFENTEMTKPVLRDFMWGEMASFRHDFSHMSSKGHTPNVKRDGGDDAGDSI